MRCIVGKGVWQSDLLKVNHTRLPVRINEEIASIHVRLGEDDLLVAKTDLLWSTSQWDPFESLFEL